MAAGDVTPKPSDSGAFRINFGWLIRLRFGAVVGQFVVILVVSQGLRVRLPLLALSSVLLLELLVNAWALALMSRGARVHEGHVTLSLGLDLILFSTLLYLTGGPANPFSFLYLIHIALAAVVLPPRTSFALVASALACSLGLFWVHVPLPHDHTHHTEEYGWHLRGMWVAFGLAACLIVYFNQRVLRELRAIEGQLSLSRERAARGEAVAALAMLSTGAAHELASPLSTIALASGELLRRLPEGGALGAARDDVLLIRSQVERCRGILEQLAVEAGQAHGSNFGELTCQSILDHGSRGFEPRRLIIEMQVDESATINGSLTAVSRALRNLLSNALDASAPNGVVRLSVAQSADSLAFTVEDDGPGMTEAVLARATEPFFTTKPPGRGMGLGLFLTQSVADQLGGKLEISARTGTGTRARLLLPSTEASSRTVGPVGARTC